jgi:hypothetical protein
MGLPVLSGLVEDLLRALVGRIGRKVKVARRPWELELKNWREIARVPQTVLSTEANR